MAEERKLSHKISWTPKFAPKPDGWVTLEKTPSVVADIVYIFLCLILNKWIILLSNTNLGSRPPVQNENKQGY